MWIIIVIALIIVAFCYFMYVTSKKNKEKLREKGFNPDGLVLNVKYMCGHPDLNEPVTTHLGLKDGGIYLVQNFGVELATIPENKIKNIYVEDSTTIQHRPTVVRFLALGLLAFAWQKKKKDEQAYLGIEWNDGRFDHDTIFEFEGVDSVMRANTARNKLIQQIRKQ
ncbi:MAG: hypothetical protein FWC34_11035 [Bacteroidetes bacterium]|nr:hypothetical protein [Bacteroidota bacterium]MCL2302924.1 hypothetical protein [Lentimicrobiaceae bacterium]